MNTMYKEYLGQVLGEKRRIANINKRQLSMMIGVSRLTIRKIESGETNPSTDVLLRITQCIGISLAEVFDECERRLGDKPSTDFDEPYVLRKTG